MIEKKIDILSEKLLSRVDAICFTSNGVVKSNGELVMGAGVALAFARRFTRLPRYAGECVRRNGNICQLVYSFPKGLEIPKDGFLYVIAFPTKNHWKDPSDLNLIVKSSKELMLGIEFMNIKRVALPRPGCQNGGLDWEKQVKPEIEGILDDRVVVVYKD